MKQGRRWVVTQEAHFVRDPVRYFHLPQAARPLPMEEEREAVPVAQSFAVLRHSELREHAETKIDH
jgi:hypothetical protein